nr:hypothetical protein [Candidatus Gracilibacteria bacterium]
MTKNIEILENKESNEGLSSRQRLDLLKNEVYQSISKEFNVSYKTAERLSNLKTETGLNSLNSLKIELGNNKLIDSKDRNNLLSLENNRLQDLYNALKGADKITSKEAIENIEVIQIGNNDGLSKNLFPKLYEKSINPENPADQVLGFCLGGLDSCSTTIKFLFDIGSGAILSPHHTYLIISGKGQYKKVDKKNFILALILSILGILYIIYKLVN